MSDDFDVFDADPVTSDAEDTVASEVEDTEADALRAEAGTTGVTSDGVTSTDTDRDRISRYVATCRWCRVSFETLDGHHEHDCGREPVASCRFCGETHTARDDPEDHIYTCSEFRRYHESEIRRSRAEVYRGDGLSAFEDMEHIRPWYHEFKAYVKYDCGGENIPLRSYFGMDSLRKEHDFENLGVLRVGFEVEEHELPQVTRRQLRENDHVDDDDLKEKWAVEFQPKGSGIAPPEDVDGVDWRLEDVREFIVKVYPSYYQSYSEAKDDGRKRISFNIRPRWPDMESVSGKDISNPHDILGYDVEFDGSNIEFSRYPELLHRAMKSLRDRQGFRFNDPTRIRPADFDPDNTHKSSNITDAELYVRVQKELTGKVYAFDGTINRISMLLGEERSGYSKTVRDQRKCPGHYITAVIGPMRANAMVGGHSLAKELKHYHVKHPMAVEGGALEHPKVAAAFQNSKHDDTVYFDDLDSLERELDESILNILRWSDLPTEADSETFVDDDYFKCVGDRRFRKIIRDQLPRIQAQQDREAQQFAVAGNMNRTDVDLLDALVTDGGHKSPADLAEDIGVHLSTIYAALERLAGLVKHEYGDVQLASQYLGQQIVGKLKGARRGVEQTLEQSIDDLVRGEKFAKNTIGSNSWEQWLSNWVQDVREKGTGPAELVLGWKPADVEDARRLLKEGALKWAEVSGNDVVDFAKEFVPTVTTVSGEVLSFDSAHDFARMLPGYKARYVG